MPRRRDDDSGEFYATKRKAGFPAWAWALVALGGVAVLGCGGGFAALAMYGRTLPTQPEPVYDAAELLAAYANAPAKMDSQLNGRRVTVTGKVTGFLGDSVHLGGTGWAVVACDMRHSDVVKLSKGQTVKVRGTVGNGGESGVHLQNVSLAE